MRSAGGAAGAVLGALRWIVAPVVLFAAGSPAMAAAQIVDLFPEPTEIYADLFEEAAEFARRGLGRQTELAYDRILLLAPRTPQALIGRGLGRSWQGKYDLASDDFRGALAVEPDNVEALVGLGYAELWSGRYEEAEVTFRRALTLAPQDLGALKGVGYAESWGGRPAEALTTWERLRAEHPQDPEPPAAIGQAHLALGETRRALDAYRAALVLDPARQDALTGVQWAYDAPARLEFTVTGGHTTRGGSGLRAAQLRSQLTRRMALWARYDNSLNLDNPTLARAADGVHSFHVGVLGEFTEHWLGVGEVGYRTYPEGGGDQEVYKGELIHLDARGAFKLGAGMSPHRHGYSDELGYIGYAARLDDRWTLEPTAFYSNTSEDNNHEWRLALQAEHRTFRRWGFGVGAAIGGVSADAADVSGRVRGLNASVRIPFRGFHYLDLSVRREKAPVRSYTVATMSLTFRMPRE